MVVVPLEEEVLAWLGLGWGWVGVGLGLGSVLGQWLGSVWGSVVRDRLS